MARRRAAEHAEARTPAAHHPDVIDGAEGRRALSRLGHARWRPAGSMVADLLSAPPASSAEPAGSDRRALVPQRALPELVLARSEEHTSELQSLMRISYAVFCLKKKKNTTYRQSQYD